MNRDTDSYSKKGLGNGFISKNDRFKNRNLNVAKFTPGPGSYTTAADTSDANTTRSSVFTEQKKKYTNQYFIGSASRFQEGN